MVTSVAARFHFDGESWTLARLRRWYKRHEAIYNEEQAILKEASRGRS